MKVKRIWVPIEFLRTVLAHPAKLRSLDNVTEGFPKDAAIIAAKVTEGGTMVEFVLESNQFQDVPSPSHAERLPFYTKKLTATERKNKKDEKP